MQQSVANELYKECCAFYKVKPNKDILEQIDKPNFLTIQEIDASRTFLGELGVRALLDFVGSHLGIHKLFLEKNGADAGCVEHLCRVMHDNPSLSYVDISETPLSTPSVRLLWETARSLVSIREIKVQNCGINEEWLHRLDRCCKNNDEMHKLGYHLYGPEREPQSWVTVFLIVIGPDYAVQKYCEEILPYVSSFVSKLRLRIAPLTIEEEDTYDVVKNKIRQCREMHNYSLSWCVAIINGNEPWHDSKLSALVNVLSQEKPIIPPLRNKLGVLRDPIYKCAKHLFIYDVTRLYNSRTSSENMRGGIVNISSSVWLAAVGLDIPSGVEAPHAVSIPSESCWRVRCQSELFSSLQTVFLERPQPISMPYSSMDEQNERQLKEVIEKEKNIGSLHPKCKDVALYLESTGGPASVPLILYGASILGKTKILSWIASTYSSSDFNKVIYYRASHENQSLVVFLQYILGIFSNKPRNIYRSIEELVTTVHEAICNYNGNMILLLLSQIDYLDSCGNQRSLSIDWLPSTLPPNVKIILSLNTESQLLSVFRKRMPQPYEVLITPLPKNIRAEYFVSELIRRGLGGLTADNSSISGSSGNRLIEPTKALETAFLQKDGSDSTYFAVYTVSLIQRMPEDLVEKDIVFLVNNEIPDTVEEVLTCLLKRYEILSNPLTVQYIMLSLAASPLPISELIYICEELGNCSRHKTLPTLLMISDDGLVKVTSDSIVHLSGSDVRRVVLSLYSDIQNSISILVETHLYRLINTQSPDMSFCFRNLGPLMIENGSFDAANNLVLNTNIIDTLLRRDIGNYIYVIDLVFRLLNARELLEELGESIFSLTIGQSIHSFNRESLRNALINLQSFDKYFFFQSALLSTDASPYYVRAVEAKEVPYTVLVPLNRGEEDSATYSFECKHPPVYSHFRGEYLVVTTTQEVMVYSTKDFQKIIARTHIPFEQTQNLRGALIATGTRVVVIGDGQLLLWDFVGHSFTLLEDTTSSLCENALDSFGLNLAVRHPSHGRVSIVDVTKKKVVKEFPNFESSVREVFFCSTNILALSLYDIFLIKGNEVVKLAHTGVIRCVNFSNDGHLIASSVKEDIWIWSGSGELLHLIDAGLTPIEGLYFNTNGTLLLSWQAEGVKLWKSLHGKCITRLEPYFNERVSFACFTEDDSCIVGRCNSHLCVWDTHNRQHLSALICPSGHFTFLHERNQMIIATTSKNEVKLWNFNNTPLPSIQIVKEKPITTMWRKNAKISHAPISQLEINFTGTIFAAIDTEGKLFIQPIENSTLIECNILNVQSVAFLKDTIIFSIKGDSKRFFCKDIYKESIITEILLPKDVAIGSTLNLITESDGNLIAVISNFKGYYVIYVYSTLDWTLTNQFIGHSGKISKVFFVGDFLFSLGEDRTIRFWTLIKHAERALYLHDCNITAIAAGAKMTFFFVDEKLRLFYVHMVNAASSTQAHFVVDEVKLTLAIPENVIFKQATLTFDLLVMTTEEGSVYMVDLSQSGAVSRLLDYKCLCVTSTSIEQDAFVMTGHSNGEVILHHIRFAGRM